MNKRYRDTRGEVKEGRKESEMKNEQCISVTFYYIIRY
jgi:hypothetical protein